MSKSTDSREHLTAGISLEKSKLKMSRSTDSREHLTAGIIQSLLCRYCKEFASSHNRTHFGRAALFWIITFFVNTLPVTIETFN